MGAYKYMQVFNKNKQLDIRRYLLCTSHKITHEQRQYMSSGGQSKTQLKLMYEGKLANRILYLKSVSLLTSVGLAGSYGYVISQKGISIALAGLGFAFVPFFLSPIAISWFFKRYITALHYNPNTKDFTAHHYGWLINKKSCTFRQEDVTKSDFTSMLNTFTVNKKPFFLHDEDLEDVESVELYKKMIGLEKDVSRGVAKS